jgi:penicillin-binding protein 2
MNIRRAFALLMALLLFSACDLLGSDSAGQGPDTTATADLGQPDGVARAFLDAWTKKDYAGMYSLLSPNSQKEHTLDDFTSIYTGAEAAMTLNSLTATPSSVLPESTGTTAQFTFHVVYDTLVLGQIERDLTMNMVFADNRWGIAWSPNLIFDEMAGGNTLQLQVESPARANIYDRNGLAFVTANASTVTIQAVPGEISPSAEGDMLDLLSRVLRLRPDVIQNNYAGFPADWKVALGDADAEVVQANLARLKSYPGLYFEDKTTRRYYNALAPHVMGYTSYIPKDELAQYQALGYPNDAIVGVSGLEKWGEQYLAGTRGGTLSVYTPGGQFVAQIASRDSKPAQSLYTTLDRNFQMAVQDTLIQAYQAGTATWTPTAGGAAIVVMDVHTGNILAMASYPDFDPNILNPLNNNPRGTPQSIQELIDNPLKPFLNRATQGQYPAGSIFKIVTTTAGYESGIEKPDSTYTCLGYWDGLGEQARRYDWKKDGHGTLTFAQALTASCDPWFYQIGLLTGQQDPMIIPNYARQYGFGQKLGLQVEEESPGLIPDPNWLKQTRGQDWSLADSVNIAIGQGDVLVTPLQVAVMVAAVANGGSVYRPHFVDHIALIGETPSVTFQPEVIGKVGITADHLKAIQDSMRAVVTDADLGTAQWRLGDMQIPVAGKTGTAQVSGATAPPIAWFAGYAPFDNPEIAVVVMVENGGEGSVVAAPIFRRVVEEYFNTRVADWPSDWYDPNKFEFVKNDFGGE